MSGCIFCSELNVVATTMNEDALSFLSAQVELHCNNDGGDVNPLLCRGCLSLWEEISLLYDNMQGLFNLMERRITLVKGKLGERFNCRTRKNKANSRRAVKNSIMNSWYPSNANGSTKAGPSFESAAIKEEHVDITESGEEMELEEFEIEPYLSEEEDDPSYNPQDPISVSPPLHRNHPRKQTLTSTGGPSNKVMESDAVTGFKKHVQTETKEIEGQPRDKQTNRFSFKKNVRCDLALLSEVEFHNPYACKNSKPIWEEISNSLQNSDLEMPVTARSCRERVQKLLKNFTRDNTYSRNVYGIDTEELDNLKKLLIRVTKLVADKSNSHAGGDDESDRESPDPSTSSVSHNMPMARFSFRKDVRYDLALLTEVEFLNPYAVKNAKLIWKEVANKLQNGDLNMSVTARSCRERVQTILTNFRRDEVYLRNVSGTTKEELNNLKKLLSTVAKLEADMSNASDDKQATANNVIAIDGDGSGEEWYRNNTDESEDAEFAELVRKKPRKT